MVYRWTTSVSLGKSHLNKKVKIETEQNEEEREVRDRRG